MINKLYFKNYDEFANSIKYILGEPYIISIIYPDCAEVIYYAIGEQHNKIYVVPMPCTKEDWFEKLLPEDKYDAIWEMHDYD